MSAPEDKFRGEEGGGGFQHEMLRFFFAKFYRITNRNEISGWLFFDEIVRAFSRTKNCYEKFENVGERGSYVVSDKINKAINTWGRGDRPPSS